MLNISLILLHKMITLVQILVHRSYAGNTVRLESGAYVWVW